MVMVGTQRVSVNDGRQHTSVTPLQLRGRFFTAIVLPLARAPDPAFYEGVETLVAQTPHFFSNAPFVLDLDRAEGIGPTFDFIDLARELKKRKVMVIGVQNGTIEQNRAALGAGLITLPGGSDAPPERRARSGTPKAETAAEAQEKTEDHAQAAPEPPAAALLVTDPVRSGQRVFAERGDLVVVAAVSNGAELIARGNIHVYGRMRGRALAGVGGDQTARIFCQSLEAELIAIAGLYKTSDAIAASLRQERAQAFLDHGTLRVEPLK